MFSTQIHTSTVILFAASLIPVIFLLCFYMPRISRINRHRKACENLSVTNQFPEVSVIVYSNNDTENLTLILNQILRQDYPSGFEVIVVNDGSSEEVKDIVKELSIRHKNLYMTYTPDEARYLSRKKLSLTIGIKAARYKYVIITRSNCDIQSPLWLTAMARHFADGKKVVIGYASYKPSDDTSCGARLRAFNSVVNDTIYLSSAIGGKPYRGIDANIGYSRELFFRNKGFSHSLNLHYGDDDIFVSEIATPDNTTVELSEESHVYMKYRRKPKTVYRDRKHRYDFTARYVRRASRRFFAVCSLMMWTWLLLSILVILTTIPNLIPALAVATVTFALWIPLAITWRRASLALHSRKVLFSIPFMLLQRPFHNAWMKIRSLANRNWNYTWQKI